MFNAVNRSARLGLLVVVSYGLAAPSARAGQETQASVLNRTNVCGPNAIFMFLVMCGANPTESSMSSITYGAEGASLAQMAAFAEKYGVHTEVRKYAPEDFQRMRLPAICQTRGVRTSRVKHFHVAYRVDPTGIWTLDGTTGKVGRIRTDRIADYLSGYALVRKPSFLSRVSRCDVWFAVTLLTANLVLLHDLSRRWFRAAPSAADHGATSGENAS